MKLEIVLTFAQQEAANSLLAHLALSPVAVLRGAAGAGKTTILKTVQAMRGGVLLGAQQVMNVRQAQGPAAIEEAFFRMIEDAVEGRGLVLVDDLSLVTDAAGGGDRGGILPHDRKCRRGPRLSAGGGSESGDGCSRWRRSRRHSSA